jgi:hypothetical protein
MDRKVSALERAFQLARSGRMTKVADIKKQLSREGYDDRAVDGGPSLNSQLRELIKTASLRGEPASIPNKTRSITGSRARRRLVAFGRRPAPIA